MENNDIQLEKTAAPEAEQQAAVQQPVAQQPAEQPAAEQTASGTEGEFPSYSSSAPVKAPNKILKPILISTGAVAAAGVVGAVAAFGFASDIKCAVMGEEKYASAVMDKTVEMFVGEASTEELAASVAEICNPMLKSFAAMSEYDTEEEQIAYTVATMFDSVGESGVSMDMGINVEFGETITDTIDEALEMFADDDQAAAIWDVINYFKTAYIGIDQKLTEDAYACAFRFGSGDEQLVQANALYEIGGDAYIAFPEASDTAISIELPELPEVDDVEAPEINVEEIEALLTSIDEVFNTSIENAEIEVEDKTISVGSGEFKGKCVEVVYDGEKLGDLITELAAVIADNEYLPELIEEVTGEEADLSTLNEEAEYIAEDLAEEDVELIIRSYVTGGDNVVGIEFVYSIDENLASIAMLDTKDVFAVEIITESEYSDECFEIVIDTEKKNDSEGVINFDIGMPGFGISFDFDVTYTGLDVVECFGMDNVVGKFTFELDEGLLEALEIPVDETFYLGDEEMELGELLEGLVLTFEASKISNGLRYDYTISSEDLGTYTVYVSMAEGCEKLPMSYEDSIDVEEIFEQDGAELIEVIATYYADKLFENPAFDAIFEELDVSDSEELFEEMIGDDLSDFIEEYGADYF